MVNEWYRAYKNGTGPQVFRLFGPAGTGKTSLARYFSESIGDDVLFVSYTGKAAYVMVQRGVKKAMTLHKAMYKPSEKSKLKLLLLQEELDHLKQQQKLGEDVRDALAKKEAEVVAERTRLASPSFTLQDECEARFADMICVDEGSMVGNKEGADLLTFGKPVLVMADTAQLPPVYGPGYFTTDRPDVMLQEIHRQARDNPIIRMSIDVREGRQLNLGRYGDSRVISLQDVDRDECMRAEQLLVGKNKTRRATNNRVRDLLGRAHHLPVEGDKLVCLRNNHELGLLNGSIWYADQDAVDSGATEPDVVLHVRSEDGGEPVPLTAHKAYFEGFDPKPWDKKNCEEFDYGYALTVHKAQGSQWRDGFLFDEWFNADTRRQWLYTGITRFAEKVTVVRM